MELTNTNQAYEKFACFKGFNNRSKSFVLLNMHTLL